VPESLLLGVERDLLGRLLPVDLAEVQQVDPASHVRVLADGEVVRAGPAEADGALAFELHGVHGLSFLDDVEDDEAVGRDVVGGGGLGLGLGGVVLGDLGGDLGLGLGGVVLGDLGGDFGLGLGGVVLGDLGDGVLLAAVVVLREVREEDDERGGPQCENQQADADGDHGLAGGHRDLRERGPRDADAPDRRAQAGEAGRGGGGAGGRGGGGAGEAGPDERGGAGPAGQEHPHGGEPRPADHAAPEHVLVLVHARRLEEPALRGGLTGGGGVGGRGGGGVGDGRGVAAAGLGGDRDHGGLGRFREGQSGGAGVGAAGRGLGGDDDGRLDHGGGDLGGDDGGGGLGGDDGGGLAGGRDLGGDDGGGLAGGGDLGDDRLGGRFGDDGGGGGGAGLRGQIGVAVRAVGGGIVDGGEVASGAGLHGALLGHFASLRIGLTRGAFRPWIANLAPLINRPRSALNCETERKIAVPIIRRSKAPECEGGVSGRWLPPQTGLELGPPYPCEGKGRKTVNALSLRIER